MRTWDGVRTNRYEDRPERGLDRHDSYENDPPGHFFWRVRRLKSLFGRRSMERQSDQKLGHQAERERNHQEHAAPRESTRQSQ
jgi:hypothetical protein